MSNMIWEIKQMDCYPQTGDYTNVVFNVHWQCYKRVLPTAEDPKTYFAILTNTCPVSLDTSSPYTAFENLTQEQVLNWIWSSGVDKTSVEEGVQAQIDAQMNPPIVTPPLPWAN